MNTDSLDNLLTDQSNDGDGIKRDRYQRPMLADPNTGEMRTWLRPSSLAKTLDDNYNLHRWETRHVVKGIGIGDDLYALASSVATTTESEDKATLDRIADDAKARALAGAKSNLGTASHGFMARVDRGEEGLEIPPYWFADVTAYRAAHKAYGLWPHEQFIETFVVVPELGAAGRFDRLKMGDGWTLPRMDDIKTGSVYPLSCAIQLAIYAHASHYLVDAATNTWAPMPEVDQQTGIVTHLPVGQGRCDFLEIDIEAGWEAALLAKAVYDWRKRTDVSMPLSKWAPVPDDVTDVDDTVSGAELFLGRLAWVKARVAYVVTEHKCGEQLARMWSEMCVGVPTFPNGGPRDNAEIDRVAAACNAVEMTESLPFFDPDPAKQTRRTNKWIPTQGDNQ